MKKAAKIILVAVGAIVLLLLLAFALLNSPLNKRIVWKIASEYIVGSLDYDRLKLSLVPNLGIKIDSLSLVSQEDTLLSVSTMNVSARLRSVIRGEYDILDFSTKDMYVHYMSSGDEKTNWQIFKNKEKGDTSSRVSYPIVNLQSLVMTNSLVRLDIDRTGSFVLPLDVLLKANAGPSNDGDGMNLSVREFFIKVDTTALDVKLQAEVEHFSGIDPHYDITAEAGLALDRIKRLLPRSFGVASAAGNINVDLNLNAMQSELNTYKFQKAEINGTINGNRLALYLPSDSLRLKTWKPYININSGRDGLGVTAMFDSVYVEMGSRLLARAREMKNTASITKEESHGKVTPRMALTSDTENLFVQMGSGRIRTSDVNVNLSAQKHVSFRRDTAGRRRPRRERPDSLEDVSLKQGDILFSLDSTITNYLKEWDIAGRLVLSDAGFASPEMPLRTRVHGTDINFTGNDFTIDSMHVESGTSDLALKGSVRGLRRALSNKGMLRTELRIDSKRLNINEIVAAFQRGKDEGGVVSVEDETDESFVVDSLSTSGKDSLKTGLIIVPGNVMISAMLRAEEIDVRDIVIDSMTARLKMQDRTVQMTQTNMSSNYGKMKLDAYYSTRTKKDISAGLDLGLSEVSAAQIIGLLPKVDDMMPALKSFNGILGCQLSATTQLDTNMNVLMPTLDGLIKISGEDLSITDAGDLKKITRLLLFRDKNIGHIDNLHVSAVVHDNMVEIFPFELGVDRYKLALYGKQGFDDTMYYHVSILKSPFLIRFGINIFGTTDNWRFRLCFPKYKPGHIPGFEKELDNVHVNIAGSIKNIFKVGADKVRRYNRREMGNLDKARRDKGFSSFEEESDLSLDEQKEVLDIVIDNDFEEADKALEREVDAILAESSKDIEKIMKEYASQAYQQNISNQIDKLKAQSEKKKASQKQKNK